MTKVDVCRLVGCDGGAQLSDQQHACLETCLDAFGSCNGLVFIEGPEHGVLGLQAADDEIENRLDMLYAARTCIEHAIEATRADMAQSAANSEETARRGTN